MASYSSERSDAHGAYERERERREDDQGSVSQLITGLIADAQTLVRREIDLAKTEVSAELNKAREGGVLLGAGVGLAVVGGILLGHMLAHLLQDVFEIALWISYLVVGAILTVAGALLLRQGVSRMRDISLAPSETIDSVRKDVEWIKEQSPSDKI
jgi:hypothetical protein